MPNLPLTDYYGSSNQSPNGDSVYSSNRNPDSQQYRSQITTPSGAQHMSFGSSAYDWSGQSSYPSNNTAETGSTSWRQDTQNTNYRLQRGSTYGGRGADLTNSYSQNYYGRSGTSQASPQDNVQGLSNAAYVSGLEAANSKSNGAQTTTQQYGGASYPSSAEQNHVKSPTETHLRHLGDPLPSSSSHPMQAQNSSFSTSSQQLAANAAAALAGAVNRRYPPKGAPATNATNSSWIGQDARPNMSATPQRTSSPQVNVTGTSQQYTGGQQQSSYGHNPSYTRDTSSQAQPASATSQSFRQGQNPTIAESSSQTQNSATPQRVHQPTGSIASLVIVPPEIESTPFHQNTETSEPVPTFVDPARVFNPYHREHERKRQQAEAEAKRKAEEAARAEATQKQKEKEAEEAARYQRELTEQGAKWQQAAAPVAKKSSEGAGMNNTTETALPVNTMSNAGLNEEAAMAVEMKDMLERMKAFRNRDPSLFQKLWDDMRKPSSNGAGGSIPSTSPQLAQQSLPADQATSQANAVSEQRPAGKTPQGSTFGSASQKMIDTISVPANGWRVVVENNPEGLQDMGRFPAERRVRSSARNKRTRNTDTDKLEVAAETTTISLPALISSTSSTPIPPSKQLAPNATPAALLSVFPPASAQDSSKQSPGTVWPVERRNALVGSALKALKANPKNANIELTKADLHKMLENNPSYITLCEMLERKGLCFHRSHFARELLNSVPELKSPASNSLAPASTSKPVQAPVPVFNSLIPPPPAAPAAAQPTYPAPNYPSSSPPLHPQAPVQPQQPSTLYAPPYGQPIGHYDGRRQVQQTQPITFVANHPAAVNAIMPSPAHQPPKPQYGHSTRPQPTPGSKEAAARKHDFSELIDLTELGENDNYVMPNKHAKLDDADSDAEMEMEINSFQAYQTQPRTSVPFQSNTSASRYHAPPLLPAFDPHANTLRSHKPESSVETASQRMILAKPLSKDEAFKKVYYDPKTVARDILIATGRHPSERPLNVHLAGVLGKYIELDSDLSTFEWDEIDPGGPPAPKVDYMDLPASRPRYKIGERVPNRPRRRGPKTFIDKTRQPDQERRQKPTFTAAGASAQDKSPQDLSHLRLAKKQPSKLRHSLLASEQEGLATPSLHDPTLPSRARSHRSASNTIEVQVSDEKPSTSSHAMETPQVRKRGRPPGSKNKFPTVAGLREQAIRVNIPPRETTPTKDKFRCKWRKCNTSLHNLDTLRKHIGRVHRPNSDQIAKEGYTCWWKKCRFLAQDNEGAWVTTQAFDHWEDWLKHIEKDHITPIAMKWGDGPATQHVGKQT